MNALARVSAAPSSPRHDARRAVATPGARRISCLPGGVLASNGSDMAVHKARPADGSEGVAPAAPRGQEMSDADVCRALTAGEAWAAEVVYDRVEDVVSSVLYRLMGPGDGERDDLAQQALERVISTIVSGRFSHGCSLRSW